MTRNNGVNAMFLAKISKVASSTGVMYGSMASSGRMWTHLLFWDQLDCQVFPTLGWHHASSREASSVFLLLFFIFDYMVATTGFHRIGTRWNSVTLSTSKLKRCQQQCLHWQSSEEKMDDIFIIGWTIPLSIFFCFVFSKIWSKQMCWRCFRLLMSSTRQPLFAELSL